MAFDPGVVSAQDIAQSAEGILEANVLLGSTVTVHIDE
jgi:hypothetical protein